MADEGRQPLYLKLSLVVALLGLLSISLYIYQLPKVISAGRVQMEADSLRLQAAHWHRIEVELLQLQGREQRLRALLASRMDLEVDTARNDSRVGELLLGGSGETAASAHVPVVNPVRGVVSRDYDPQTSPLHGGVDIAAEEGDLVVATANGTVIFAGWVPEYGNMVILVHKDGFVTRYGHLKRLLVTEGETLFQSQTLGELGSSGFSSAPHLHYEIWQGRRRLDPRLFLQ